MICHEKKNTPQVCTKHEQSLSHHSTMVPASREVHLSTVHCCPHEVNPIMLPYNATCTKWCLSCGSCHHSAVVQWETYLWVHCSSQSAIMLGSRDLSWESMKVLQNSLLATKICFHINFQQIVCVPWEDLNRLFFYECTVGGKILPW